MPPAGGDEELEEEEEQEPEHNDGAGAAGGVGDGAAGGVDDDTAWSAAAAVNSGDPDNPSGLAEDLFAAGNGQNHLPANDPVRVETAKYLRKCTREGTTPAPWILQMVLPPGGVRAGPTEPQMQQLITSMVKIEKAIVSQLAATRGRRKSVTFDASSYGP